MKKKKITKPEKSWIKNTSWRASFLTGIMDYWNIVPDLPASLLLKFEIRNEAKEEIDIVYLKEQIKYTDRHHVYFSTCFYLFFWFHCFWMGRILESNFGPLLLNWFFWNFTHLCNVNTTFNQIWEIIIKNIF